MTYLALNAIFLAVAGVVAVAAVLRHRRTGRGRRFAAAIGITVAITIVLTAVFDNVMIAAGLFAYDADRLLGLSVGLVPVEDFAYPVGAAILLPSLWILTGRQNDIHD